ncbi:MAG: c-type cytochrome [Deltaproteobacteria bacterium]|nr:c-type cytochrome [Deltaproteobacteria bacterium]
MAEAKTIFETRCSTCHGLTGAGDGPAAAALNPKPRSYSDPEWQAKVTDDHIAQVIVKGGDSVGLSPLMTANPDLESKPEVVKGLVSIIRSYKK